jgi:hypothetical protein
VSPEINAAPGSVIIERVLALWDRERGWIPGAAREALAEALGIDPALVRTSQQIARDRRDEIIAPVDGESFTLRDRETGCWWAFGSDGGWHEVDSTMPSGYGGMHGFDEGVERIARIWGITSA